MLPKKCPRLLNETRTPGSIAKPDGPTETWQTQCELRVNHSEPHEFGKVWFRVYA